VLFKVRTDLHVVSNLTEVSAVTPLIAVLLFPIPVNLHAYKSVKYEGMKSKVFYLWDKKFKTLIQKADGSSEALI
jgi:hypothetical protein